MAPNAKPRLSCQVFSFEFKALKILKLAGSLICLYLSIIMGFPIRENKLPTYCLLYSSVCEPV
jgi:hypothetical protein